MNECADLVEEYRKLDAEKDPIVKIGIIKARQVSREEYDRIERMEILEEKIRTVCPRGMDEVYRS